MLSKYCIYSKMNIDRINNIPIMPISKYIVHITTTTTYKLLLTTYSQQLTTYIPTYIQRPLYNIQTYNATYDPTTVIIFKFSRNWRFLENLFLFGEDETLSVGTVSFREGRYLVLQNHAYLRYGVNGSERTDGIRDRYCFCLQHPRGHAHA